MRCRTASHETYTWQRPNVHVDLLEIRVVSFTKRLTHWVESRERDPLRGCEVRYLLVMTGPATTQLVVQKQARFFEFLLHDTGEGEFATGTRGHLREECRFRLDDESGLDDVLDWLVREVHSWAPRTRAAREVRSDTRVMDSEEARLAAYACMPHLHPHGRETADLVDEAPET